MCVPFDCYQMLKKYRNHKKIFQMKNISYFNIEIKY